MPCISALHTLFSSTNFIFIKVFCSHNLWLSYQACDQRNNFLKFQIWSNLPGKCEITSQNHGFVVSKEGVEKNDQVVLTHIHLNDGTVAGISLKDKAVFSVQYHPEASSGPHDSRHLFDQFVENIKNYKKELVS